MIIGGVNIGYGLALGPMAGVTDLPFRMLCREFGCSLLYTEMVSAKALHYQNKNTEHLLRTSPDEHPLAVQLFGSDPEIVSEMGKRLSQGPHDLIDLNMGCPVPKIVQNGEGSALMKDPLLAGKIMERLVKASEKPVTVKIRKGFGEQEANAPLIAHIAEECGISAVAVHGRTREQYYGGAADWEIIRAVKEQVSIPVIGNGDIKSGQDAKRMMEETGCDGVMVARAAQGNPWIFREIRAVLSGEEVPCRPSYEETVQMILRHADMQVDCFGEYQGIRQMRKHVAWYTAGYPHSALLRRSVNTVETLKELKRLLTR